MDEKNKRLIITIDGPAGAGKSTIAKKLARTLGYHYINTGDIYRYVTYCALQERLDVTNCKAMDGLSKRIVNEFIKRRNDQNHLQLFFNHIPSMMNQLHSPEIGDKVSIVARMPSVRNRLLPLQRMLAQKGSVVMEGRDIGSVILPDADLKIFLDADVYTRIKRRYKELKEKGYQITIQEVKKEIVHRDNIDSKREIAPLTIPDDATVIDTSNKSIHEVIQTILVMIQKYVRKN